MDDAPFTEGEATDWRRRLNSLEHAAYDNASDVSRHEAVCAARYETIADNLSRIHKRINFILMACIILALGELFGPLKALDAMLHLLGLS